MLLRDEAANAILSHIDHLLGGEVAACRRETSLGEPDLHEQIGAFVVVVLATVDL